MRRLLFCLLAATSTLTALPRVPITQVARANNGFGLAFYSTWIRAQGNQGQNNLVFSPYGISASVAIAYLGTAGDTTKQIADTLFYPLPPNYLGEAFKRFNSDLNTDRRLGLGISAWAQSGLRLNDEFRTRVDNYYENRFKEGDFQIRTDTTRNDINVWIAKETHKKIPFFLSVGDVPRSTRIFLTGAMTLQAAWEVPFAVADTKTEKFFLQQDSERTVSMMNRVGEYAYYETDEAKVVSIPYRLEPDAVTRLSFWAVLPKNINGLKSLEEGLTIEKFNDWKTNAVVKLVNLKIPRFRMTTVLSAKEVLEKMGMTNPFSSEADFSTMTDAPMSIGKIFLKTLFLINEQGSDAAGFNPYKAQPKEPLVNQEGILDFVADHPFMFFVLDESLGQLLFLGRFAQP